MVVDESIKEDSEEGERCHHAEDQKKRRVEQETEETDQC